MDDWADEKKSLVSVSEEGKMSSSDGDEQPGTSISTRREKEKMNEENREMQEENGESAAGTGIIDSIASKFGVTIPGHSTDKQGGEHEEEHSGGMNHQLISSLPESHPMSEDGETTASMNSREEKKIMAERNVERQGNGETSAGSGIIDSIAAKFGVTVPVSLSTKEENEEKVEETQRKQKDGGIIHQLITNLPDSLPMSEDDLPTADEALLLISIIED